MTTYYALPTLVTWDNSTVTGWSLTSGGANAGSAPAAADDIVFDANSGSSRTITCSAVGNTPAMRDLTMTGANTMTLVNFPNVTRNVVISGAHVIPNIHFYFGPSSVNIASTVLLANITIRNAAVVTLAADLVTTGSINHGDTNVANRFNANNFNVTLGSLSPPQGIWDMGTGTWTVTTGEFNMNSATTLNDSATATVKMAGTAAQQILTMKTSGTLGTLWNANTYVGATDLLSGLKHDTATNLTVGTLRLDPATTLNLKNAANLTVSAIVATGELGQIAIRNAAGSGSSTLTKTGAAAFVERCTITRVTGAPAATWNARSSTDGGNNTNWTFIPPNRAFLSFF